MKLRNVLSISVALAFVAVSSASAAPIQGESCEPSWVPTFGPSPALNGDARALAYFDAGNGAGPELYAGGSFDPAIKKWDGAQWTTLPDSFGMNEVHALAVFDDGNGPGLYVGGFFMDPAIRRWDGESWTPLGSGVDSQVLALAVFDDGSGKALYVGGTFTTAGGAPASAIAKWDGASWSPLGAGVDGVVRSLVAFDDGTGPALYVGGAFTSAGGQAANRIAKWNGSAWSPLGSGTSQVVRALAAYDDGSGPGLYAAGNFTHAGGSVVNRVARWDGASWTPLGSGVDKPVHALTVVDDPVAGPLLCAGGEFTLAGGSSSNRVASWNGTSWSALGNGVALDVHALIEVEPEGEAFLLAGSSNESFGGPSHPFTTWDGSSWSYLGDGLNAPVLDLTAFDDGNGPALFAGGLLWIAGGSEVNRIAKWDGAGWSALGSGVGAGGMALTTIVYALKGFDDGSGPALYAGGMFTHAGGVPVNHIARWDGSSWSSLGTGVIGAIVALETFDDGSGPALFAGGSFTSAGGVPASRIAKWNGVSWSALGSGLSTNTCHALAVFDDGGGPALFAGGDFTTAGGGPANRVAKWNGSSWAPLGSGIASGVVNALTVFDDGSGPALFAGGSFNSAGGATANNVAKWDGASWSPLGAGLTHACGALVVFDDGSGPALYAGGLFTSAGGSAANRIARWDGVQWTPLGDGLPGPQVLALAVLELDGGSPALYVGGDFNNSPAGDAHLARWQGCLDLEPPLLDCPVSVAKADSFSGPPGAIVHFSVTASDALDPDPIVVCVPPSGSFFPRGTTLVSCTATDGAGNQSTCEFPVTVQLKAGERSR